MKIYKPKTNTRNHQRHTTSPNALRLVAATAALGCMVLGMAAQYTDAALDVPIPTDNVVNLITPDTRELCSLAVVDCQMTDAAKPTTQTKRANATVSHDYAGVFAKACNNDTQCIRDLTAIATVETGLNPYAIGDGGKSYGLFQIHRGYHPDVSVAQAQNPLWAATWTVKRLKAYGYPTYRSRAIMSHNGSPGTAKTIAYLAKVNAVLTGK